METILVKKENPVVIKVAGRIDALNAGDFEEKVRGFVYPHKCNILFDLSNLDYMSSAGIRVFLILLAEANTLEKKIGVVTQVEIVKEVFEISGLDKLIPQYNSIEEAIHSLK